MGGNLGGAIDPNFFPLQHLKLITLEYIINSIFLVTETSKIFYRRFRHLISTLNL